MMGFIADAVDAGVLPAWAAPSAQSSLSDHSSTSQRSVSRDRRRDPRLSGTRSRRRVSLARQQDGNSRGGQNENGQGENSQGENSQGENEDTNGEDGNETKEDEDENEDGSSIEEPSPTGGQDKQDQDSQGQGPHDQGDDPVDTPDITHTKQQEEETEGSEDPQATETPEATEVSEATETPEASEGQEDPEDPEDPDPDDPDDEGDDSDDEDDDDLTTTDEATMATPTPTEQTTMAAEITTTTDTSTTLSTTTSTRETPTATPDPPTEDAPDNKAGVIAGSIVGSLVVVALVFLGIVYYRRWNKLRQPRRAAPLHSSPEDGHGDDGEDRVPMAQAGDDQQAQHVGLLPKGVGSGTNRTSDSSNPSAFSGNNGNQPYPSPPYDSHPHDYEKVDLGGEDVVMQDGPPVGNGNAKGGWMGNGTHYAPVSQQDPSPYHNSIVAGGGGGGGGGGPGLGAQFPSQDITSTPYQSSSSDFSPPSQYMPYEGAAAATAAAPFQPQQPQHGAPPLQPAAAADPSLNRFSGPPVLPSVPEFSQESSFTDENIFGPGSNNAAAQNGYPTTHDPMGGHIYNYNYNYTDTSDGSSGAGSSPYDGAGRFGPTPAYGHYQPFPQPQQPGTHG